MVHREQASTGAKDLDRVAAELERQPLTPAQRAELERRIAWADAHAGEGVPWDVVKAEARARWSHPG